jgi:thiol-disulfide isomerase/thioredoxin
MCAVRSVRILAVSLVVLLAGWSLEATDNEKSQSPLFPEVEFTSLDGQASLSMSAFRGRPVLLTFWASWCGPCRVELPELSALYGELAGKGFVLMTVNVDASPVAGRRFLDRLGLAIPVYRLNPRDTKALGIDSLPTNILLDRDGRLVQVFKGYTPAVAEEVRRLVLEMVAPPEQ